MTPKYQSGQTSKSKIIQKKKKEKKGLIQLKWKRAK